MKLCGKTIKLIVYDFDGVMTDNKALIFYNGDEAVLINRSDGLAIEKIKSLGMLQLIISTEKNPTSILALVSFIVSWSAQQPVPIIIFSCGKLIPDFFIMFNRCSKVNELASPVLPSKATPSAPDSISHVTWSISFEIFGSNFDVRGVSDAA